jgi:hypothetical protein
MSKTLKQIKKNNVEEYNNIILAATREGIQVSDQMTIDDFKEEIYNKTVTRKTLAESIANASNKKLRR